MLRRRGLSDLNAEDFRQIAGIENLCGGWPLLGGGRAFAGVGDEILVVHLAKRE